MAKQNSFYIVYGWAFPSESFFEAEFIRKRFPTPHKAIAAVDRLFARHVPAYADRRLTIIAYRAQAIRPGVFTTTPIYARRNFVPLTAEDMRRIFAEAS